jgi:hypothetical protein
MFARSTTPMLLSKRVVKLKRTKPSVEDPLEQREVHHALDTVSTAREGPIRVPEARTLAGAINLPTPSTINPEPPMGSDDDEDALSFGEDVIERTDGDSEQLVARHTAQHSNAAADSSEPDIDVSQEVTSNDEEYDLDHLPAVLAKQTRSVMNQLCRDVHALRKEVHKLQQLRGLDAAMPLNTRTEVARPTIRVTPKDVSLEPFWGSSDTNALTIDRKYFLPLINWLQACRMQLRASQLPQELWVSTMLGALRGAARKAFTRKHGDAPIDRWTLEEFQLAVASLVPDHEAQFTDVAMEMQFKAKTLCDDIAQFALMVRHGELDANSRYVFIKLQQKLLKAVPEGLRVAAELHDLKLEFTSNFNSEIAAAQTIAEKLHVGGHLDSWAESASLRREQSKPPRHKEHRGSRDEPPRKLPRREEFHRRVSSAGPKPQSAEHRQLAMKYNRCFGCGYYVARGQVESHMKQCHRSQEAFGRRMAQLQKEVAADPKADPNAKFKGSGNQ